MQIDIFIEDEDLADLERPAIRLLKRLLMNHGNKIEAEDFRSYGYYDGSKMRQVPEKFMLIVERELRKKLFGAE
jgi:hypothetical protein